MTIKTLKDISTGPDWAIWAVGIAFAIISILLISGRGANLIAGYNTSNDEEKSKYDKKKLCRIVGAGMALLTAMIFVMAIWEAVLPAYFATVFMVVTVIDCIAMLVLKNTVCRK